MRFKSLDGLRGIAAFGIVIYHAHYGVIFGWMWTLVDLFFVLSGFLIGRIIFLANLDGSFSFPAFFMRRALRIWPVYYLTLSLCLLASLAFYVRNETLLVSEGLATAPFFLQYTHHYLAPNLMGESGRFIYWFHHSWSVAVEEQFYLILPLCVFVLRRHIRLFTLLVAALVPLAAAFRFAGGVPILLVTRMDALAIGILIALYWVYQEESGHARFDVRRTYVLAAAIVGAGLVAFNLYVGLIAGAQNMPDAVRFAALALGISGFNMIYGCIVLAALKGWLGSFNLLLESRALLFLGSISYALYMFHVPIRGAMLTLTNSDSISSLPLHWHAVYFGMAIGLAWLSKKVMEGPINNLKHRFPMTKA